MRILHVLNHTRRLNGHVNQAIDLACEQSKLSNEVRLARGDGNFDDLLSANNVKVLTLDQRRHPFQLIKSLINLILILRRERIEIVHAHMMTSAVLCWIACKLSNVPLVTTVHNEFERSSVLMGVGHRVIAVSNSVAESMRKRGINASKIRTVLNGTIGSPRHPDTLTQAKDLGRPSILFVGGLHPRKGLPVLLEAFDGVVDVIPNAKLHIVGDGPFRKDYELQASNLRSARSITFHGGQDDPRPWYLGADVFVCPSLSEPAGLVISEACEAGCAIVASNVGGIPEMLNSGAAGYLVPPGDVRGFTKIIVSLLSDPSILAYAKTASANNIVRMELRRVVSETIDVYKECLKYP